MATAIVDGKFAIGNNQSNVYFSGANDNDIISTAAAEETTGSENDELDASHAEEMREPALDDTRKITTCCLQSPCYKLCTTAPSKEFTITKTDFIFAVFSLCTYIADIGTDIWVAVIHYQNDDIWWMALTLAFVLAPSLTTGVESFIVSGMDCKAILIALFVSIPGGFIYIFTKHLLKEWEIIVEKDPQKKKRMSDEILEELQGSLSLRFFEAFLEAAPQLVLQLYIIHSNLGRQGHMGAVQWCSVCISLASLSLPVTSAYKMKRLSFGKYKVSVPGTTLLFAFHFFTIGARVLSLAVLAVFSGYALLGLTLMHFVIMFFWILSMETSKTCEINFENVGRSIAGAFIYIFCFIDNPLVYSRLRYAFYYTLTYMENIGMLLLWYFATQSILEWQRYLACILIIGGYFIGILCLVVYYVDCHPNNFTKNSKKEIKVLVPLSACKLIQERKNVRMDVNVV